MKTKPKPKPKPSASSQIQAVRELLFRAKEEHWQDGWGVKEKGPKAVKDWHKRNRVLNFAYDKIARLTSQQWNKL